MTNGMDMHLRQKEQPRMKVLDRFQEPRSLWMRQGREKEVRLARRAGARSGILV